MTKLILATESFPYGKGEKSFILPELKRLQQYYDVTILSHANREQLESGICGNMPDNIKMICYGRPELSAADKLKAFVLYLLDRDGRREIKEILREKKNRKERIYQSLSFYAQTLSDQRKLRQSGILSTHEQLIYYSYWYTYYCYSVVRESRKYSNIRVITRTHGVDLYHERIPGNRQPFKHQMETRLDAIVFACHYGKEYYREHIAQSMEPTSLHVCRVGTEPAQRREKQENRETWHLVSCSSAIPLKRIPLIIDGLALVNQHKIHWTHIGDGSDLRHLTDYAGDKLDPKDNITYTFRGYMDNDKVTQYYMDHPVDCFITTSSTEGGSPVSIQEAMRQGIPIIGTDVGGITEMIRGNGLLLPSDPDGETVAAAICRMLSFDENTLKAMRDASYAIWRQEFCIDVAFRNLMDVFGKIN